MGAGDRGGMAALGRTAGLNHAEPLVLDSMSLCAKQDDQEDAESHYVHLQRLAQSEGVLAALRTVAACCSSVA